MSHRGNLNASEAMIFIFTLIFSDIPTFFPDFLPASGFREPRMSKEKAEKLQIYLGVPLCLNSKPSIVSPAPAGGNVLPLNTPTAGHSSSESCFPLALENQPLHCCAIVSVQVGHLYQNLRLGTRPAEFSYPGVLRVFVCDSQQCLIQELTGVSTRPQGPLSGAFLQQVLRGPRMDT